MSKTINKEKLDAAIYMARCYYDPATPTSKDAARVYCTMCRVVDGNTPVSPTSDLLAAIFAGYKPDATNEDMEHLSKVAKLAKTRNKSLTQVLAHELATHRAMQLAPTEFRSFMDAMYRYKTKDGTAKAETPAELKQMAYGKQGVNLSTDKAIEEFIADSIVGKNGLYKTDAEFMEAVRNVVSQAKKNGDVKVEKGAKTWLDSIKAFLRRLGERIGLLKGEEKVQAQQVYDEVTELKNLFEQALGVAFERVNAEKSANKTGRAETGRGTIDHSLKNKGYWHSDLTKAQMVKLLQWVKHDIQTSTNSICDTANWTFRNFDGLPVFAIYSTMNESDPTILYEVKGAQAVYENQQITDLMGGKNDGLIRNAADFSARVNAYGREQAGNSVHRSGNVHAGNATGNDAVDGRTQGRKPSAAFKSVLRNLLQDGERGVSDTGEQFSLKPDTTDEQAELSDANVQYSLREKEPPKNVGIAYKVFYAKNGQLYPPMVANPGGEGTPVGVWLDADVGVAAAPSKTGRPQVKAGGKGTQGGSGSLAFRPGWHLGDLPLATQFNRKNPETGKKELFPADFVWAECEYAMDHDYQEEAMSYGYTENGKFRHAYAGLPRLPEDGYYRYRTNPKPDTVPWVITGAMRVKRILTDAETDKILRDAGVEPLKRQGGPLNLEKLGLKEGMQYSMKDNENAPVFYSKMEREIEAFKQNKLGAASVVSMLRGKGVKAEEIKWSGIETFLEGKKSVTRSELLEYLRANRVEVTEEAIIDEGDGTLPYSFEDRMALDAMQEQSADLMERVDTLWQEAYNEDLPFNILAGDNVSAAISRAVIDRNGGLRDFVGVDAITTAERELLAVGEQLRQIDQRVEDMADRARARQQNTSKTHWSQYKLDGGENYREYLYKIPGSTYSNHAMHTHWKDRGEGVLAHARVQDFKHNGQPVLFVEEIQSDWHNEGHKRGYRGANAKTISQLQSESNKAYEVFYATVEGMVDSNAKWEDDDAVYFVHPVAVAEMFDGNEAHFEKYKFTAAQIETIRAMVAEEDARKAAMKTAAPDGSVPDAPYSKTYHEYVLKTLLRKAAEGDYDYLAWTTGELQEERWSSEYAEGYRIEYDQDIPKFLNKYGKQWGAKVEDISLDGLKNLSVHAIPVTEAMKKSVLHDGQPKYSLKDSEGNNLTREQQDFFKDSKMRNDDGSLMVMYHGSEDAGFHEFNTRFSDDSTSFFFVDSNTGAKSYSSTSEVYAPKTLRTAEDFNKFFAEIGADEYSVEEQDGHFVLLDDGDEVADSDTAAGIYAEFQDWTGIGHGSANYKVYLNLKNPLIVDAQGNNWDELPSDNGGTMTTRDYAKQAKANGHDGVIFKNIYDNGPYASGMERFEASTVAIAFDAEQVKSVENKQPTSDPDIRFSMKSPVEETKNLIAMHNKNAEAILAALDLGGFPMPSIAIVKDDMGFDKFGDISVLFRKETISPTDRRNKVYGADAWTPTRPAVGYKVSDKVRERIEKKVRKLLDGTGLMSEFRLMLDDSNVNDQMSRWDGDFKFAYKDNEAMKIAFLMDKGIPFKPVMKEKSYSYDVDNIVLRRINRALGAGKTRELMNAGFDEVMKQEPLVRKLMNDRMEEQGAPRIYDKPLGYGKMDNIMRAAATYERAGETKEVDAAATRAKLNKKFTKKIAAEYEAWLDELSNGIIEKKGLRNNRDMFTPSGNRRSFEQLYMEFNLENIVKAMKGESEKGAGVWGTGNIFGAATKDYSSIAEIKADSDRLVAQDEETHKAEHEVFTQRFAEITKRMLKPGDSGFGASLDAGDAAVDALLRGKTVKGILRELKTWHRFNATEQIAQDIYDLAEDIKNAPTTYFEAKPQRAVGFDEVVAVVMPRKGNAELKARLEEQGVQVLTYNPNTEGDRLKKVNSVDGIKFSLKDDPSLTAENEKLREANRALKEQFKLTEFAKVDRKSLDGYTKRLLKDWSSGADINETRDALDELYTYIANGENGEAPVWEEAFKRAYEVAEGIIEQAVVLDDNMYQEYKELRNRLRTSAISIDPAYSNDLMGYENLQDFRKRNFGRIKMANNGTPVDVRYAELAAHYPELFDEAEHSHPADQLTHIAEVLDDLQPVEINPYSHEMRESTTWLANDIMERFFDLPQAKPTFADKAERKLTKQAIKDAYKLERVREQKDERIRKLIEQGRERAKKIQATERDKRAKAVQQIKDHYKAKEAKASDSKKQREMRAKILRHTAELSKKLIRASDRNHIPQELQGAVAKLLECINLESNYTYDYRTDSYKKNDLGSPTLRTKLFANLRKIYTNMANELTIDPDLLGDDGLLAEVVALADKKLADMNLTELTSIWHAIRAIEASIQSANIAFNQSRWATISEAAEELQADNFGKKEKVMLGGPMNSLGKLQQLTGLDMMTPEAYFHRLGPAGDAMFRMMRNAQDDHIRKMKSVSDFTHATFDKLDVPKLEKQMHTVKLGGQDVRLSTAQIMELYVLMRREQAREHIMVGGILPDVVSANSIKKVARAKPIRGVRMSELLTAFDLLSAEQKRVAEMLQEYASTQLSAWGNEAAMKVYNYEKFTEKMYWPIRVNKQETASNVQKDTQVTSVAGRGFTKGTKPHANNSVMIGSIFDTFSTHASEMATYAAWLAPMEDINRIRNYTFKSAGETVDTVKAIIDTVHGKGGTAYLSKLLADLSNGVKGTHGETAYMSALVGNYKAASVGANLRVIVQQPTAILRALAMIDPQYFVAGMKPANGWKKAMKYAPIAQWKDWGYFDVSTGRQMKDVLFDSDSALGKLRNAAMWGAGKADSISWGMLWNAVEAETKHKRKDLTPGTELFYEAVAERFTEIVDRTQVVDGILQRSQIMRSADSLTKMATAFMAEPTKQYNMMMSAAYDAKNGTKAQRKAGRRMLARTATAFAISAVANAMAQALMDAVRDDDKEKDYWEKWLDAFKENLPNTFNPAGYIPFVKDIASLVAGYDVSRMDMESIEKLLSAAQNMLKALSGEGKYTVAEASAVLFAEVSRILGLPVANIKRDAKAFAMLYATETGNYLMQYRMEKAALNLNYSGNSSTFMDILFNAYQKDHAAYEIIYEDMVASGYDPEKLAGAMETRMKKAEGVTKVGDLDRRYLTPDQEPEYERSMNAIENTGLWSAANGEQRDKVEAKLYGLVTGSKSGEELQEKIDAGRAYGLDETEYLLYTLALDMYDQPSESGEYGSYTAQEKADALLNLNLGDGEIAYLWGTDEADEAYAAGINMTAYIEFKAAISRDDMKSDRDANGKEIKGRKRQDKITAWVVENVPDYRDRLWLMATLYSKYEKSSDYKAYFGN